jgi:hypothetical protein
MKQGKLETCPLGQRVAEAESTRRSEFEDMSDAELVALTWSDVLARDNGQVQLSVVGVSDGEIASTAYWREGGRRGGIGAGQTHENRTLIVGKTCRWKDEFLSTTYKSQGWQINEPPRPVSRQVLRHHWSLL